MLRVWVVSWGVCALLAGCYGLSDGTFATAADCRRIALGRVVPPDVAEFCALRGWHGRY